MVALHKNRDTETEAKLEYALKAWNKSDLRALPIVAGCLVLLDRRNEIRPLVNDLIRFRQTHPGNPYALAAVVSTTRPIDAGRELFLRTFRGLNKDLIDKAPALKELMEQCMKELHLKYADLHLVEK